MRRFSLALAAVIMSALSSHAQDVFLGEIRFFAGDFAPKGWAFCDGQIMLIGDNQALFSILGSTYGGDGLTTFALPDMRGRFPLHEGKGPDLTPHPLGRKGGSETIFIETQTRVVAPGSGFSGINISEPQNLIGFALPPYIAINCIIAVEGTYPARN